MMHVCMCICLRALWGLGSPQKLVWPPRGENVEGDKLAPPLPNFTLGDWEVTAGGLKK